MSSSDGHELGGKIADAKSRICLYGSSDAIVAFARLERLGVVIGNDEQEAAFMEMVIAMRRDSVRGGAIEEDNLRAVLLSVDDRNLQRRSM